MISALTIAGSDSGCGAGVQADLLAMAANGVFGVCAFASLTAQNPSGVSAVMDCGADFLRAQLESVNEYFSPRAAKTGMLYSAANIAEAAGFFERNPQIKFVCDPVMVSTSGSKLLQDDACDMIVDRLAPLSALATPNLDEARFILSCGEIDASNIGERAEALSKRLGTSVLFRGGHLKGGVLTDVLSVLGGGVFFYETPRVCGVNTHGSGCTLSAAIAARLALSEDLKTAVENAREYLLDGLKNPLKIAGQAFINHFPKK